MMAKNIQKGKAYLGIELGSTRIKACLIDDTYTPIATGGYEWENQFENGYWTYDLSLVPTGLQACFADLAKDYEAQYGEPLKRVDAIGISGMMHGYLPFDAEGNLLTPFRTWRNTTTPAAAEQLSELFDFNIPQRWSVAHLYQAILNSEEHIPRVAHITTLAGYVHYLLTGVREMGIGEAAGMFPVKGNDYNAEMLEKFDALTASRGITWSISKLLPKIKLAGESGAHLTEEGARLLDPTGRLESGIPICPPEGDADTGMVATNAVKPGTGNLSAGTSTFAILALKALPKHRYAEIDIAATPAGHPVAMVHCTNGCSELDVWVKIFGEFAALAGHPMEKGDLYELLYRHSEAAEADCGGVMAYNYLSGEHVTGVEKGNPLYFRTTASRMNLANFMRSQLYATMATLKLGLNILLENEDIVIEKLQAHGGLFKVKGVAQQILANAVNAPVSVMETAGEGGAWGMALLAAYMIDGKGASLDAWLDESVFAKMDSITLAPEQEGVNGFEAYLKQYQAGLCAERALSDR